VYFHEIGLGKCDKAKAKSKRVAEKNTLPNDGFLRHIIFYNFGEKKIFF